MNIAIIGASGFLGKNLIKHLLNNTNYNIKAIAPNASNINIPDKHRDRVKKIQASVFDYENMKEALVGIDVAYYLVHMMATEKKDFHNKESESALITSKVLADTGVKRIIYMSGLGDDRDKLSQQRKLRIILNRNC